MTIPVKNPFISAVRGSLKIVSSTNYTLTDLDGYDTVLVTTGASDRTITLPAGTLSAGRRIKIRKQDSGAGKVILSSAGAETIDGVALSSNGYYITAQWAWTEVVCDGTNWFVVGSEGDYIYVSRNNITQGSGSVTDIGSIPSISIGTWDVSTIMDVENTTSGTSLQLCLNTVSVTMTGNEGKDHIYSTAKSGISDIAVPDVRFVVSSTSTTIYAIGNSTNGGVANWYGKIVAKRVR